jgi:beta-glucanase (GH16 family)
VGKQKHKDHSMAMKNRRGQFWWSIVILTGLLTVMLVILFLISGTIRQRFFPETQTPFVQATSTAQGGIGLGGIATTMIPTASPASQTPSPEAQTTLPATVQPEAPTSPPNQPTNANGSPMPDLVQNQENGWTLIFSDDFNNGHLNANKWTTCYWWDNNGCTNPGNHEMQWYQPKNVQFDQQSLLLTANQETVRGSDGKTYAYTSGMVTTGRDTPDPSKPVKFAFQYGLAEIRAKVTKGQGLWPAFWLLPANNSALPEIDVLEIIGMDTKTVNMTLHYKQASGDVTKDGNVWAASQDLSAGWHTYAVDWEPNYIVWYVDGIERWRVTDQAQIPAENMYMLLNLAVGGDWPGPPGADTPFPSSFQIDYVRVWQQSNAQP